MLYNVLALTCSILIDQGYWRVSRVLDLDDILEKALDHSAKLGSQYTDIRMESINATSVVVGDNAIDQATSSFSEGIGIRVLANGAWGFAATSDTSRTEVMQAVEAAFKMAEGTSEHLREKVKIASTEKVQDSLTSNAETPFSEVPIEDKIKLALGLCKVIRADSTITSATVTYGDSYGKSAFLGSEGSSITGEPSRGTLIFVAVAKEGDKIRQYRKRIGVIGGFEKLIEKGPESAARNVAERASALLKAEQVSGGRYTVVADPEHIGVFAHEALGHAAEADFVITGESILAGKLGEKVGSEELTVYDDPSFPDGFGSFKYDSEGTLAKRRLIVEKGVLREYILNKEAAAKLNLPPNGGARAQGYNFRPIPRMSNTYISAGDHSFEELIEDIETGIYVKGTRGGQVNIAIGSFQFSAQEAFMIEKGEITKPLLDVSLSGITLETMQNIDAVGNDFSMAGIGFCGKGEQNNLPVGNGGPSVRVRNVVVGGA
jgi:TldD protein